MDSYAASIPSLQQCEVGQPLTCLAFSPHIRHVAAGGRDIRLFTTTASSLSLQPRTVSTSDHLGQSTSISDLSFHPSPHPNLSSLLLAASTSGLLLLYSLASPHGLRRPVRLFDHHQRTVNRVAWHSSLPDHFYSASQDGSVVWWDARVSGCVGGWEAESGAVRDVQMDKAAGGVPLVAAAYEDGSVAVWDTRGGNGGGALKDKLLTISAHQGYTLTLDWHPTDGSLLATGGKDKNICVWDVSKAATGEHSKSSTPLHTIVTSSSVHRLAWRPHRPYQLASSASSSNDFDVQLWNVHTPHIPLAIVSHHRSAVCGIAFKESGDELLTATRGAVGGGVVSQVRVAECYAPYDRLSTVAVGWSVRDELVSVEDAMTRDRSVITARDPPPVFPMQFQWRERQAEKAGDSDRLPGLLRITELSGLVDSAAGDGVLAKPTRLSDVEVFSTCARHYRLKGSGVRELCAHNASVALSVGRPQLAHIWDVLALLYADKDKQSHSESRDKQQLIGAGRISHTSFATPPSSLPSSRTTSRSSAHTATPRMSAAASPDIPNLDEPVTSNYLSYQPVSAASTSQTSTASPLHHPVLQTCATRSTGQLSRQSILLDTLPVIHMSHVYQSHKPPVRVSQPPATQSSPILRPSRATVAAPSPAPTTSPPHNVPRVQSKLEQPSHLSALLLALLDQLANAGDTQTCCSVLLVLNSSAHTQPVVASLPVERLRRFFFHYIDQLHRMRLSTEATSVHQLTPPHLLAQSNQHNTSVGLMCGECKRGCEAADEGCYCSHCGNGMSVCSVCELLVRGLFVWCQGCGHGGHADHMAEWFAESRVCPTGCMHRCVDELVPALVDVQ